jgi:hypothetical protein
MPAKIGETTPANLELNVKVTWGLDHQASVVKQARGEIPLENGRMSTAKSDKLAMQGRALAEKYLRDMAIVYAKVAQDRYALIGNDHFNFNVQPQKVGNSWRLIVVGDPKTQMWARIVETGHASIPMRQFIENARKRREIKVTRMVNGKVKSRGPKEAAMGTGFYLTIPMVSGKVTRGANGKLTLTRNDGSGLSERLNGALKQFLAVPDGEGIVGNHEDTATTSPYRTGEYNPTAIVTRSGGKVTYNGANVMDEGNDAWLTTKYKQVNRVRKAGVFVNEENEVIDKRERSGSSTYQDRGFLAAMDARRRNPSANEKGADLIRLLTGDGENSMRINDPDAVLPSAANVSPETRARFEAQRGEAISFRTISTRQNLADIPARSGMGILKSVLDDMQSAIRTEIREIQRLATEKGTSNTLRVRAMIELLEQAAR